MGNAGRLRIAIHGYNTHANVEVLLQELKEKNVLCVGDLKNNEIPTQLQAYISWAQKLWSRLKAN